MKPLFRWTLGPVKNDGFNCLVESIKLLRNIYPEADYAVCYNQVADDRLKILSNLDIELVNQTEFVDAFPIKPSSGYQVHWKLYPPRMRVNSHEIVLDNDVVIFDRISEINDFLERDTVLLYQGLHGLYGCFKNLVPKGLIINSGIYGMPPNFNFIEQMKQLNMPNWQWSDDKFEEQGLISAVLSAYHSHLMVPLTTVPIIESHFDMKAMITDRCRGYHFVGVNYLTNHANWRTYLEKSTLFYRTFL